MNLVARVKGILLQPKSEWQLIAGEPGTPQALYPGYIIPLAAIGPVASVIGLSLVGMNLPVGGHMRIGLGSSLGWGLISFVLALAGVYVIALLIEVLAPSFGAVKDRNQAFKVAAYSMTPHWLAGILGLFPGLWSMLALLISLYSLYLLYLGIQALMRPPQEKAIAYTAVVIVLAIVISLVFGAISAFFLR